MIIITMLVMIDNNIIIIMNKIIMNIEDNICNKIREWIFIVYMNNMIMNIIMNNNKIIYMINNYNNNKIIIIIKIIK
jgi:hypothetical protein